MAVKPTSWIYIEGLDISIRWVQGDHFQDILRGSWSVCRDLPVIDSAPTNGRTWTDNTDVYREANRYLKAKYETWHSKSGPLKPPSYHTHLLPAAREPEKAATRVERSTDFVRR